MKGLKTCHLSTLYRYSIRHFLAFQMVKQFFLRNMFAIQGILLILTYFDLIQTIELKDRLMIYFAFQRFLADIKLTETYFSVSL